MTCAVSLKRLLDGDLTKSHIEPRKPDTGEVHRAHVRDHVALIESSNIDVLHNIERRKGKPKLRGGISGHRFSLRTCTGCDSEPETSRSRKPKAAEAFGAHLRHE